MTHVVLKLLSEPDVKTRARDFSVDELKQLQEFVEENLCEDLSLESLAALMGMSSARFARTFKLSAGQSPHQWLIAYRLKRAKEMLAKTDNSLTQVALDCGFSSQSHMTTMFSKRLGVTPKHYRQLLK